MTEQTAQIKRFIMLPNGTRMPVWGKDPDDVEDYSVNWSIRLAAGDYIVAVKVTVPDPLVLVSEPNIYQQITTSCWLAGGVLGAFYTCTFHATTYFGREHDASFGLDMISK